MKNSFRFLIIFCAYFVNDCLISVNDRPIIGILTEEVNSKIEPDAKSSIYASYVKYIEAAGGRVVPIWIYKPLEYYEDIMSKINGILFPGGGELLRSKGFGKSGKLIFDMAKKMNDMGDFFPLWGTCLGFELMNYAVAGKLWMKACSSHDLPTNIQLVEGSEQSRMFVHLDASLRSQMLNTNVAIHYHRWCFTPQNYTASGLNKFYKILALNTDSKNISFVSIVEAYQYPFYGVTFHPEKVLFEWNLLPNEHNTPHTLEAVRTSQYFANFFVNEARKNLHRFPSTDEENTLLIYNYNPYFTGKRINSSVTQRYYFDQSQSV